MAAAAVKALLGPLDFLRLFPQPLGVRPFPTHGAFSLPLRVKDIQTDADGLGLAPLLAGLFLPLGDGQFQP